MFDIAVVEVDNGVSVRENLAFDSVIEDDFLLSVFIDALDLAIVADHLLHHLHVRSALVVVLGRELHVEFLRVALLLLAFLLLLNRDRLVRTVVASIVR